MANILFSLKDTHFRFGFKHPMGRTDDFENQINNKLEFLFNLVSKRKKKDNIVGLCLTGDSVDVKADSAYSLSATRANLEVFKKLKDNFGNIYDIAGNHSLPYSSREYKPQSFHSLLVEQRLINDISSEIMQITENVKITGIDFTPDKDKLLEELDIIHSGFINKPKNKKLIVVLHEHLVPTDKDKIPFGNCLTYKEIADRFPNVDMIIAGHLHKGYPTQKVGNTVFVNIWNFTRLARDYYSVNGEHIPQVEIINLDTLETETINIPCSMFKDAFVEKDLNQEVMLKDNINEFIKSVSNIEDNENKNIENIPEKIKQRVEHYMELARNS